MKPKLRPLQPELAQANGRPVIVLRDPSGLSDKTVALPQALAPLLALCDGTRDLGALQAALQVRLGLYLSTERLQDLLAKLDEALLLDNDTYRSACLRALNAYRNAPARPPALVGKSYPGDAVELAALLDKWLAAVPPTGLSLLVRGLVSPHIDYARGGSVYAQVWSQVAACARRAEVAVILGTDHQTERARITLTLQHYATPFGTVPTERSLVEALAEPFGPEAFAEELHHRSEHSIELALVWLQHMRRGQPLPLLPVLCGSFHRYLEQQRSPAEDDTLMVAIASLRERLAGRRALIIAAGDLAHSGPAFGDGPQGPQQRTLGRTADEALIGAICRGDVEGFWAQIAAEGDRRHICGAAPIYLALRLLEPVRGEPAGYLQAPADAQGASFVSVAGVALL